MKIILSRIDAIGDTLLTLPMTGLLKERIPGCEIIYLGKNYVKEIVTHSTHVDQFLDWSALEKESDDTITQTLAEIHADMIIHVSNNQRLFKLAKKAKIPRRVGTARRLYGWFYCNKLLNFSRRASNKTEAQLNLQLIKHLGANPHLSMKQLTDYVGLQVDPAWTDSAKKFITPGLFNLIIHPGSNGHGQEWPIDYYIELIQQLPTDRIKVIVTGTSSEAERFQKLIHACPQVTNLLGKTTLMEMLGLVALSDGLIGSSTGPTHIAGALNKRVLGLYTSRVSHGYDRWQPLGHYTECLVHPKKCTDPCPGGMICPCIRAIEVNQVKEKIMHWIQKG